MLDDNLQVLYNARVRKSTRLSRLNPSPDRERSAPTLMPRWSLSFWFGLLISVGCLVWAIRALDWRAVANALAGANLFWIGLSLLTVLVTIATRLVRWAVLFLPRRLQAGSLLSAMLVGQLLNYFTPARAGDLVRAYLLGYTEGESKAQALGTIALEKMWDLGALLALVWLLSLSTQLPGWFLRPTRLLALATFAGFLLACLTLRFRARALSVTGRWAGLLPAALGDRLQNGMERLLAGFDGLRQPRVWFWAALWSAATWGIGSLTNHTVMLAMGVTLPFSAAMLLMAVLQLGVAVPSLPGRVGIFEGLCIVVLAPFGVGYDKAFAVGLTLHGVTFLPPILLGLFYIWRLRTPAPTGSRES
jgi:uncharacterized protein (TIRG00374 family)